MTTKEQSILVFGGGELQLSIIKQCRELGVFTVVIDPDPEAKGQKIADVFEVVEPNDLKGTLAIMVEYAVAGIVTAATDKPLIMMARVASIYGVPFFSEKTAIDATDKFLMKQVFQKNGIPCAQGRLIDRVDESLDFPLIVKPRDNSGSRGIVYCRTNEEVQNGIESALRFSRKENILVEEYIEGQEYSIEAVHFNNRTHVLQITEKRVTQHPFNVELGHIQPAGVSQKQAAKIALIISKIAKAMGFTNCASHTEIKINERGIFVIETSPRLGGDFITSTLVPNSTGVNMEGALIDICLGNAPNISTNLGRAVGIFYFDFDKKVVSTTSIIEDVREKLGVIDIEFSLDVFSRIPPIRNSLDRYGYMILAADNRGTLLKLSQEYLREIELGI